jgi:hypothetical protein
VTSCETSSSPSFPSLLKPCQSPWPSPQLVQTPRNWLHPSFGSSLEPTVQLC